MIEDSPQNFLKNLKRPEWYEGAWGKLIHEKNRSRKSCDTVPLKYVFVRNYGINISTLKRNLADSLRGMFGNKGASLSSLFWTIF